MHTMCIGCSIDKKRAVYFGKKPNNCTKEFHKTDEYRSHMDLKDSLEIQEGIKKGESNGISS
jgi:hypothetical protein